MTLSLLIVDDHAGFRSLAHSLLEADGFEVVGEIEDGESAVGAVEELSPDVVLLDVQLPGIDGFEVAQRIAQLPSPPRIVLTSSRDASAYGARITSSPACGFVVKHEITGGAIGALLEPTPS
jgi:DNA-binding NarL/FixJ family response regulator